MSGQYSGSYTKSVDITVTSATLEPGFSLAGGVSISVYSTLATNSLINFATIDGGANLDSFGVVLLGSNVYVTNEASGIIKVDTYGLGVRDAHGTIMNAGTIEAVVNHSFAITGVPFPVYGAVGILLNQSSVTVSNVGGGLVQGAYAGIDGVGGNGNIIINAGVIRGGYGTVPTPNGGYATRPDFGVASPNGAITNESGGTIGGYLGVAGFKTPILNNGLITGSGTAVTDYFGTISNLDSAGVVATITGGTGIIGFVDDGVINDGVILGTAGPAVVLDSIHDLYLETIGPTLDNQAGGTIEGATAGLYLKSIHDPTITNAGLIQGNSNSEGIKLLFPVDLHNSGTITGANGVLDVGYGVYYGIIDAGGASFAATVESLAAVPSSLVNTGTIDAVLSGAASASYGVLLRGSATIDNYGLIQGGARGIAIEATRSVSTPGYVFNVGTITGAGVAGVVLNTGGTLVNDGTISGGYYAAVVFNDTSVADRLVLERASSITGRILAHGTAGNVIELTDNVELGYPGNNENTILSGLGVSITGFTSIQVDLLANWTLAASAGANFTGGVSLLTDAQLTNDIRIAGTISGGVGDVVDNAGQVVASSASAYAVVLNDGGSITNSGMITGAQRAVDISGGVGTIDNSGTIAGGNVLGVQLGAGGTLVNGGSIGAGYYASVVFNSNNAARVMLDTGAQFGGRVLANGQGGNTVEFAAGSGTIGDFGASFMGFDTLQFDTGADWRVEAGVSLIAADTVSGLGIGATLVLDGFAANPAQTSFIPDHGLVLANSKYGNLFNIDAALTFYSTANFTVTSNDITDTTTIVVNCYGRGTRIETPVGDIEIEGLRVGDLVTTASGAVRPISWIGTRQFDPRFVGRNPKLLPIRICTDALADGVPRRDLLVSPEHAMLIDGVLVAARYLVNGVSIRQEEPGAMIDYFHIELDSHDAVLAEGAAAETYVEDGDRGMFHNAADDRVANPGAVPPARYCAERIETGPVLDAIRGRIDERAGVLAVTTADPDLHLLVDGQMVSACERQDGVFIFSLPCGADEIVLASRIAEPAGADRRGLGVAVSAITIDGRPIDLPTLKEPGWHGLERNGDRYWRWTNGAAGLPAMSKACRIEVTARPAPRYRIHYAARNQMAMIPGRFGPVDCFATRAAGNGFDRAEAAIHRYGWRTDRRSLSATFD